MRFFECFAPNSGERASLIQKRIVFSRVKSTEFSDYIKGQSSVGVQGKFVYWSCLLGTASSIVAINSNSFVSQFEGQLPGPFIYFSIVFLGLASFYTAFVTRFVSVGNYERGLKNFLKYEKNSVLTSDEEKFFKIAFERFSTFKADPRFHVFEIFDKVGVDKKYVVLPRDLIDSENFKYIQKLLWGILRDDDIQFVSQVPQVDGNEVPHVFHVERRGKPNLGNLQMVLSRLRLDAPRGCLPLYACCDSPLRPYDSILRPVKALLEGGRFVGFRALPDMLMFSSVFTSLTNLCRVNQAEFSMAGRVPLLLLIMSIAYVRTYVNDQFKVTEAYANLDLIVDRLRNLRFTRWENFRIAPPFIALLISVICFIYGYSYGYRFALSGPSDMVAQMQWMIPPLETWLASSPQFASLMHGLGNVYEDLQAISGGLFYFITGYRALSQQLWGAFHGSKKPVSLPYKGCKEKWAYILFIIANGFDNVAFAVSGTYFALSSANVNKPWNILKLFSESMGRNGYLAFSICLGALNALQNFSFSWYKASESMQGFFNSLSPVGFIDGDLDGSMSSSSGGEGECKMSSGQLFQNGGASVPSSITHEEESEEPPIAEKADRTFCALM